MSEELSVEIAQHVWATRYRASGEESGIEATRERVAHAAASVETGDRTFWQNRFQDLMDDFRFIPAGRILAGAGVARRVTLFNCFVMGRLNDSLTDIFHNLGESACTLQYGGGIGLDFSPLRPAGARAGTSGTIASGPVSFMHIWDAMSETMQSAGNRRGAMMATLRCDHPDIERFIDAKREPDALSHCNLSVLISDSFMQAVREDGDWALRFPVENGKTVATVPARQLWDRIISSASDSAEPGMLFVDTINRENNLAWRETITATNPCGEVPLPPYGACNLGSINLTRFVHRPFEPEAELDLDAIAQTTHCAVRFLDDIINLSIFPLPAQRKETRSTRRIGLGITGLADALIMLGLAYDNRIARQRAEQVLTIMRDSAYRASTDLAREKGTFPVFNEMHYLEGPFIERLDPDLRQSIKHYGIRNSHLLAIAPTGTISLLAGNVSSGIEPVYAGSFERRVRTGEEFETFTIEDAACRMWRQSGKQPGLPPALKTADEITPRAQLELLAGLQPLVDSAISKTIQIPESMKRSELSGLFQYAHERGLKGVTVYRPHGTRGTVISEASSCARQADCQ